MRGRAKEKPTPLPGDNRSPCERNRQPLPPSLPKAAFVSRNKGESSRSPRRPSHTLLGRECLTRPKPKQRCGPRRAPCRGDTQSNAAGRLAGRPVRPAFEDQQAVGTARRKEGIRHCRRTRGWYVKTVMSFDSHGQPSSTRCVRCRLHISRPNGRATTCRQRCNHSSGD